LEELVNFSVVTDTVRYYTGIRLGVIKDKQEMPPLD
jgi:hypothetical protein